MKKQTKWSTVLLSLMKKLNHFLRMQVQKNTTKLTRYGMKIFNDKYNSQKRRFFYEGWHLNLIENENIEKQRRVNLKIKL